MTIYSTPLSDSQRVTITHIKSARKQYSYWKVTGSEQHETLMWLQLLLAFEM